MEPSGASLPPPPAELTPLFESAFAVGLEPAAVIPAEPLPAGILERLDTWLAAGRAGEMHYLPRGRPALADLRDWKPWVRSAAIFRLPYPRAGGGFRGGGRVARYALGRDYHHVLNRRMQRLGRRLRRAGAVGRFRPAVDAAPVLEREWALRGGLGFRGKNTLLLDPSWGPWVLLGELLVDTPWPGWRAERAQPECGSCTRCLDACPTNAFPQPWLLEPRRCLSYLTIESSAPIPFALRRPMDDWVFGCDVCLEVCPFGSRAQEQSQAWGTLPVLTEWSLEDLLGCSRNGFERAFRGSPIRRAGWAGLLRSACVALGNLGRGGATLARALEHEEPLVRGHAAWALGRLGERGGLAARLDREDDPWVTAEIDAARTGTEPAPLSVPVPDRKPGGEAGSAPAARGRS